MRKHVIALLMLFAVAADAPQRAEAGAFATEITQILPRLGNLWVTASISESSW